MERFHEIADAAAIVSARGVYKQLKVFRRGLELYVQYGGGYVRLYVNGSAIPALRLEDLELPADMNKVIGSHGRLIIVE